jgi:hypothetical protein
VSLRPRGLCSNEALVRLMSDDIIGPPYRPATARATLVCVGCFPGFTAALNACGVKFMVEPIPADLKPLRCTVETSDYVAAFDEPVA